jgi:hypothetical protein
MAEIITKAGNIDVDEFDDDLILMNLETRQVLVLNAAAKILWQAMDVFTDPADLLGLLTEAMPQLSAADADAALAEMVGKLSAGGFLRVEPATSRPLP